MSEPTLYDRLGGDDCVARLTDEFYARVLQDPLLEHFFKSTDVDKLKRMQREFFSAALDGPVHYSGIPLGHAHAGLGINSRHFGHFVQHLLETLQTFDLTDREVRNVIERISTYKDEIVGAATQSG